MVRDGYYYGAVLIAAAVLVAWLTRPSWAIVPLILAAFFFGFSAIRSASFPPMPGLWCRRRMARSRASRCVKVNGETFKSISIFLNVFNVHVNRSPMAGIVRGAPL